MKKFLLKVSIFIIYAALWYTFFPYFFDPLNVFHPKEVLERNFLTNRIYVKMKHVVSNPDKFDSGYYRQDSEFL